MSTGPAEHPYATMYRDELVRWLHFYERRLALVDDEISAPLPGLSVADLAACTPSLRAALVKLGRHTPLPVAEARQSAREYLTVQRDDLRRELASRDRAVQRGALDAHPEGRVPQEVLDRIKEQISLVGAVEHESSTRLGPETARGERRGACPFCGVASQPFVVHTADPHDEWWHCHACGQHGDVIDFTMDVYDQPFRTAVELLARRCGLDWPPRAKGKAVDILALARRVNA